MNTDIQPLADEEYPMPCAEALLAGTLALMTAHAQACCDGHRAQMAAKIVDNLSRLAEHPLLTPQFHTMLWNLRTRWQLQREHQPAERDARLWHAGPGSLQ